MSRSEDLGKLKEIRLVQKTIRYCESGNGEPVAFVYGYLFGDVRFKWNRYSE